jgi:putrescine transport system ATP-binding protein
MLKLVQLGKFAKRKPHQLSGGQQQRVALARSLAKQPQLLLLDEPLGALDKKLREQTQIELVNIIEQVGVTCVMVTHDQEEAMTMASRIAVMSEGRFLQVGAPGEIYETPATRFVADFIGNVNLMDGTLDGRRTRPRGDRLRRLPHYVGHGITGTEGMAVTVALRPEKIHLSRAQAPADDFNTRVGTIKEMSYFGSFTVFHLQLASGALLKVSMANTQRHRDDELHLGRRGVGALVALGPGGADPVRPAALTRCEALFSGRGAVIGVPYAFLLLFFLLPFFIVFKISVSEMENVVFKDLLTLKEGVLQLS